MVEVTTCSLVLVVEATLVLVLLVACCFVFVATMMVVVCATVWDCSGLVLVVSLSVV